MTKLSLLRTTRARFARSANVERDTDGLAVSNFLPTSRALDVVRRISIALDRDDVEVAISITGPYGSGKSSLALLIDALLGPAGEASRNAAEEIIREVAPETLELLFRALDRLNARQDGFIRATVTAQREAIGLTVLRGLHRGVGRFTPKKQRANEFSVVRRKVENLYTQVVDLGKPFPSPREFRSLLSELGRIAPVLLLVDEFGKNLEAFADSHSDADLFLLQELAEWSRSGDDVPLALITMQHMAFDEYAASTSTSLRREWAKVQGRFEDIPYIDSPQHTRALISCVFETGETSSQDVIGDWAAHKAEEAAQLGLNDLGASQELIGSCWPLHPLSLQTLPELCERYGQNERTLFSFLAGHEPLSVASFLAETDYKPGEPLPVIRLDRLYDYFLEAALNLVNISSGANRWMEIDSRIRDATSVSESARRILKAVGILNLVSAGGVLRASPALLSWACADGQLGSEDPGSVLEQIRELENAGLLTYRDFADEYRIWHGTDFDIKASIEAARIRLHDEPMSTLLEETLPLNPMVASRHSHQSGTLRAFKRVWGSKLNSAIFPLTSRDRFDGLAIYILGDEAPTSNVQAVESQRPVVFITTRDSAALESAALEVAAIDLVLKEGVVEDWVAKRELEERRFQGTQQLQRAFYDAYAVESTSAVSWNLDGSWDRENNKDVIGIFSKVCDEWYSDAPVIKNDIANRHDLSSQAAKARRVLLEAMVAYRESEHFGIEGFGPEKTLYLSAIKEFELHVQNAGEWQLTKPSPNSSLHATWLIIERLIESVDGIRVSEVFDRLASPPLGIREGIAPVFVVAALLLQEDNIALYEHGTFRPQIADDVLERLLKNPGNFTLRHFGARTGLRAAFLKRLAEALELPRAPYGHSGVKSASVLAIVSHLVLIANTLPDYTKKSTILDVDAMQIRKSLFSATSPDQLLFTEMPEALGFKEVKAIASGQVNSELVSRIAKAVRDLQGAYPKLLEEVRKVIGIEFGVKSRAKLQETLQAQSIEISEKISEPGLKRLLGAFKAAIPDLDSWTEYVGMNTVGRPPNAWTTDDQKLFAARAKELGGAFRRAVALHGDLSNPEEKALRVLITHSDGGESAVLIPELSVSRSRALKPALGHAIKLTVDAIKATGGGSINNAEAKELLLSKLISEFDN